MTCKRKARSSFWMIVVERPFMPGVIRLRLLKQYKNELISRYLIARVGTNRKAG